MNLQSIATKFHQWGANVVALNTSNGDKRPLHKFKQWFDRRQTPLDLETLVTSQRQVSVWPYATAVALVCGISGFRLIDIDHCDDQLIVENLAVQLGLPRNYAWMQRTGSGFGLWMRCDEVSLPDDFVKANTPWFVPTDDDADYSHIELRLTRALGVVPPSRHPNGRHYQWLNNPPIAPPHSMDIGTILHTLLQYGQVEKVSSRKVEPTINHRATFRDSVFGQIAQQQSLLEIAQRLFPGHTKPAGRDNVRIMGHGGLIVNDQRGWYCFGDEIGGGLVDLFGYSLFGTRWNREPEQLYQARSYAAELYL